MTDSIACHLCGQETVGSYLCESCRPEQPEGGEDVEDRAVCMADVEPEDLRFLWEPRVPLGKLTILEGDPGEGKSFITAALAAAVTRGEGLPGQGSFEPGSALLFTTEDGLGDTVRPRLDNLGADVRNVYACKDLFSLRTEEGRYLVEFHVWKYRPALVVLDPLSAYMGFKTNTNQANQVRPLLAPLAEMAERYECAFVVVRHLTKGPRRRSIHKGLGSIDISGVARSMLLAGSSPTDPEDRALVHLKANTTMKVPALGYRIYGEVGKSCFEWTGKSSLTAFDLVAPEKGNGAGGRLEEAREFLREMLADGPVPVKEIRETAKDAGIARRTLDEAKGREGVESRKGGFKGGWRWCLPEAPGEEPER